jgi:hypothetical protein
MRVRVRSVVAVAGASLIGAVVNAAAAGAVTPPSQDPFYAAPPHLGSYAPGTVLRSRQVTLFGLSNLASNTAYQLLYRTTGANGHAIATVTTLLEPALPTLGPRKLLSYQTAEDSLTTNCAPSYTMRGGNNGGTTQIAESGEIGLGLQRGWDVAVPDYEGPRAEYAVGPLEGRATLDSIRAVEHFAPSRLEGAATPVGLMGYSGGAIPSVWATSFQPHYAPELNLVGDAAGGIAADPIENLAAINGSAFAGVIIAASVGVNRAYPWLRLNTLLNGRGRALAAADGSDANGCAGGVTNAPLDTVAEFSNYRTPQALQAAPRVRKVFARLDLTTRPAPQAPSFFYNEVLDEIAIIKPVDELFAADCAHGAVIDYYRDPLGEHLTGAATYVMPALNYLADRFDGKPAPNSCPR